MPARGPKYDPQGQAIAKLRICGIEIRNASAIINTDMDDMTRSDVRATLDACAEKLQAVSRWLAIKDAEPKPPKKDKGEK